eukprot:3417971-Prymnesium_polylepis.1
MELHHRYDPDDETVSPFDVQRRIAQTLSVISPLEQDRFLCSFVRRECSLRPARALTTVPHRALTKVPHRAPTT